jgi:hypothetical protein
MLTSSSTTCPNDLSVQRLKIGPVYQTGETGATTKHRLHTKYQGHHVIEAGKKRSCLPTR